MPRSVHATKEYGKLRFHLSERMVEQGLSRNQIAQAIGSRFEVVDNGVLTVRSGLTRMYWPVYAMYWSAVLGI